MFGRTWDAAKATIVEVHVKSTSGSGMTSTKEYVADVESPAIALFRTTIQEPSIATNFWPPSRGAVVGVLVHPKSRKVKFDKHDPQLDTRARKRAEQAKFAAAASAPPGS